jgi:hypothetical protein
VPYLAIFGICYLVVFVGAFLLLSSKTAAVARRLQAQEGMGKESLDVFYQSMRGKTLLACLQITVITGTVLGAIVSGVVWAFF